MSKINRLGIIFGAITILMLIKMIFLGFSPGLIAIVAILASITSVIYGVISVRKRDAHESFWISWAISLMWAITTIILLTLL